MGRQRLPADLRGFLLLGGRLGDLFGHRRLFLVGLVLFTASTACGLAGPQEMLIGARAVQGLGGAIVSAVALSLMMTLFTEPADRAKAMGIFGFVASGAGASASCSAASSPTRWTGTGSSSSTCPSASSFALTLSLVPGQRGIATDRRIDIAGAFTVTASLILAVYAIVNGNQEGWTSAQTLGLLGAAAVLLAVFLGIESRVANPLVPLRLFKLRNVSVANVVGVLWAAAMFAWFFLSALYLQLVLGGTPSRWASRSCPAT